MSVITTMVSAIPQNFLQLSWPLKVAVPFPSLIQQRIFIKESLLSTKILLLMAELFLLVEI